MLSREIGCKFFGDVGSLPGLGIVTTSELSISHGKDEEEAALFFFFSPDEDT